MSATTSSVQILILDTETNGLPKNRYAPISTPGAFPAILQLSWEIYNIVGKVMTPVKKRTLNIALHPSIPWDDSAARIHGIQEHKARTGAPAVEAFTEFATDLATTNVIVAHNLAFDKPVLRAAAYVEADRGGPAALRHIWPVDKIELCTMRGTTDLLGLPSSQPGKSKPPKLMELYEFLYGHPYTILGASMHNSRNDTDCLAKCIYMLLRRGFLQVGDKTLTITP